jgi:hypothetical protein
VGLTATGRDTDALNRISLRDGARQSGGEDRNDTGVKGGSAHEEFSGLMDR